VNEIGFIKQKQIIMNYLKYGCGIDMAKEKFDVCIGAYSIEQGVQKASTMQFANTPACFRQYLRWVKKHCKLPLPLVHLMEATGVYYENLALFLAINKESVSVILPNKAKKYKESLGLKSKTDGIDAYALGRMACEQTLSKWNAPSEQMYRMRLVTRQIESITNQATSVKNQLEAAKHYMYPDKQAEKLLERQISFFEKLKSELLESLEKLIDSDEELKIKIENIKKIKGLGTLTIATVVAETFGFALFENVAQLVSYVGYDVVENQSGKHIGKTKISKKGNGRIRRCLYFPALNVVRYKVSPFVQL